ncbi:unnamed protein product [Arctogadus glacialis]
MRKAEQEQPESMLTVVDADGAPKRKQRIQYRVCRTGRRYKYRGKEFGHDVDFLLSTPEQGKEETLLLSLVDSLRRQGILLYCDHHPSTFDINNLPGVSFEAMDHFAKSFLILRLEDRQVEGGVQRPEGQHDGRSWRAVRVDVVAPPMERYAFALLGWTGSRQFERDLRRFARKEKRMLLDNHGLWDKTKILRKSTRRTGLNLPGWWWLSTPGSPSLNRSVFTKLSLCQSL